MKISPQTAFFFCLCLSLSSLAKDDYSEGKPVGATNNQGFLFSESTSDYQGGQPIFLIFDNVKWDSSTNNPNNNLPGHPDLPGSFNTINAIDFEPSLRENNRIQLQYSAWTEDKVPVYQNRRRTDVNPEGARKEFAKSRKLKVTQASQNRQVFTVFLEDRNGLPVNPYHCLERPYHGSQPIRIPKAGDSFHKGRIEIHGMCMVAQMKIPRDAQVHFFGSRDVENKLPTNERVSRGEQRDSRSRLPREVLDAIRSPQTVVAAIYFSDREIPVNERFVSDNNVNALLDRLVQTRRETDKLRLLTDFVYDMNHRKFTAGQAGALLVPQDQSGYSRPGSIWPSLETRRSAAKIILSHSEGLLDPEAFHGIYDALELPLDTGVLLNLLGTH